LTDFLLSYFYLPWLTLTLHISFDHFPLPSFVCPCFSHQRWRNVTEGVNNNVGCFPQNCQNCQNFQHHVRNFLSPNLWLSLEKNFFFWKIKIVPEMFFLLFLQNINVAVRPFIWPPLTLYLPCSISGTCLPPSCHSTFVFWANYGFTRCNNAVTHLNRWS
jgi:hypothetical protein